MHHHYFLHKKFLTETLQNVSIPTNSSLLYTTKILSIVHFRLIVPNALPAHLLFYNITAVRTSVSYHIHSVLSTAPFRKQNGFYTIFPTLSSSFLLFFLFFLLTCLILLFLILFFIWKILKKIKILKMFLKLFKKNDTVNKESTVSKKEVKIKII